MVGPDNQPIAPGIDEPVEDGEEQQRFPAESDEPVVEFPTPDDDDGNEPTPNNEENSQKEHDNAGDYRNANGEPLVPIDDEALPV
jgi:hypothetical protein